MLKIQGNTCKRSTTEKPLLMHYSEYLEECVYINTQCMVVTAWFNDCVPH